MSAIIMPDNLCIFWSSEEHSISESWRRNSICVSSQASDKYFSFNIIDLHSPFWKTYSKMISLRIKWQRADILIFFLSEFSDACGGIQIDLFSESNCELAFAAPI